MWGSRSTNEAGAFAWRRFQIRRRAWRKRFWWTFVAIAVIPVLTMLPIVMWARERDLASFALGVGVGAGFGALIVLFDSPPAHIENWRRGADGEKRTAKQLRPLLRAGWKLFNDIDTGRGNIDHVLIGPAGVFVLDSKHLAGTVRVENGRLSVRWHEDPDDGYENAGIGRGARWHAQELNAALRRSGRSPWVQPIVVLWADFPQVAIESEGVIWVGGHQITEVLRRRPIIHDSAAVDALTVAAADAFARLPTAARNAVHGP